MSPLVVLLSSLSLSCLLVVICCIVQFVLISECAAVSESRSSNRGHTERPPRVISQVVWNCSSCLWGSRVARAGHRAHWAHRLASKLDVWTIFSRGAVVCVCIMQCKQNRRAPMPFALETTTCVYIYIYRERERDKYTYNTYIYIYIYTYNVRCIQDCLRCIQDWFSGARAAPAQHLSSLAGPFYLFVWFVLLYYCIC